MYDNIVTVLHRFIIIFTHPQQATGADKTKTKNVNLNRKSSNLSWTDLSLILIPSQPPTVFSRLKVIKFLQHHHQDQGGYPHDYLDNSPHNTSCIIVVKNEEY